MAEYSKIDFAQMLSLKDLRITIYCVLVEAVCLNNELYVNVNSHVLNKGDIYIL